MDERTRLLIEELSNRGVSFAFDGDDPWFAGTERGDDVVVRLAELPTLRSLNLDDSEVTDVAIGVVAKLPSLRNLGLSGSRVTGAAFVHLEACSRLEELSTDVQIKADEAVESISRIAGLKKLYLENAGFDSGQGIPLGRLTNLEKLALLGTRCADVDVAALTKLTLLKELSLSGTQITDEGMKSLRELQSLQELFIGHTKITDAGVEQLGAMTELRCLAISETNVTSNAGPLLMKFPKLEMLYLNLTSVDDSILAWLSRMKSLRDVDLMHTPNISRREIERFRRKCPHVEVTANARR